MEQTAWGQDSNLGGFLLQLMHSSRYLTNVTKTTFQKKHTRRLHHGKLFRSMTLPVSHCSVHKHSSVTLKWP